MSEQRELSVGQVWRYDHRPQEPESRAIICHIDQHEQAGLIVHVALDGLAMALNPHTGQPYEFIQHMPFTIKAVVDSLTELLGVADRLPAFESGYAEWKAAFDEGRAGIWALPLKEAVAAMETALMPVQD